MNPSREFTESVLSYLSGMERAARLRNHRDEYQHFEQCWLIVHESFYGKVTLPRFAPVPCDVAIPAQLPAPSVRPVWAIQKYSRPMRKVAEKRLRRGIIYFILECGHELPDIMARVDDPLPKFRRCKQCRVSKGGAA